MYNESITGSKSLVGFGKIAVNQLVKVIGVSTPFELGLFHEDKKAKVGKGNLSFVYLMEPVKDDESTPTSAPPLDPAPQVPSPAPVAQISTPAAAAIAITETTKPTNETEQLLSLVLNGFEASELLDTGNYFNPQDPSLTLTIGKESFSTARLIPHSNNIVPSFFPSTSRE